jgi:DNA-directed RNA polymerase specialized sigma24 family protein
MLPPAATVQPPSMDGLEPLPPAAPSAGSWSEARPGPAWRALVDACRQDRQGSWEEFVDAFTALAQRRLRRHFHGLTPTDRADLISATLERLVEVVRNGQIRGASDAEVGAYVARAVRNQALDFVERRGAEAPLDEAGQRGHDGGAYQRALVQRIMDIVGSWPPADRLVFVQKWYGVPSDRIRRELEASPYAEFIDTATVDTRYLRLRARLRARLEGRP